MAEALQSGTLSGDFRTPKNAFQEARGSIHNDKVAAKLGFKGGTVPGSVHMDQFVPMLLQVFGPAWFETGDISLYFTQATVDREKVRAVVEPGEGRARLTMYNEAGDLICTGTAGLNGPDPASEVRKRMDGQAPAEAGRLRVLAGVRVGDEMPGTPLIVPIEALDAALETLTEPLDLYRKEHVLPPSHVIRLAHMTRPDAHRDVKVPVVGLFGALEVRHLRGPLKAGVDYLGATRILKLTESPRTENVWYEVTVTGTADGPPLARVIFLIRFMKASSPLWAEAAAG